LKKTGKGLAMLMATAVLGGAVLTGFGATAQAKTYKLNATKLELVKGQKFNLNVTGLTPPKYHPTFTAKDASIVSVKASNGKVKALKKGYTTISVKSKDGNYKATVKVYVYAWAKAKNASGTYTVPLAGTSRVRVTVNGDKYDILPKKLKRKMTALYNAFAKSGNKRLTYTANNGNKTTLKVTATTATFITNKTSHTYGITTTKTDSDVKVVLTNGGQKYLLVMTKPTDKAASAKMYVGDAAEDTKLVAQVAYDKENITLKAQNVPFVNLTKVQYLSYK